MSAAPAVRFDLSAEELRDIARSTPGLVLPSFAPGTLEGADAHPGTGAPSCDPRLLLALGFQAVGDGIVHLVSWSPGEVVRRTVAVSGVVAASVTRRDTAGASGARVSSAFEAALLPAAGVAAELRTAVPVLERPAGWTAGAADLGLIASRAVVDAARRRDPMLLDAVATELRVDAAAAREFDGLRTRQSSGLRVRCYAGRSGRCLAGDEWFASDSGWRRVRLGLGRSDAAGATAAQLLDGATVSVSSTTDEEIRRALTCMTATLLRVIAR